MTEIKRDSCKPEQLAQWKEFLDKSFGYAANQSYVVDFAPLFEAPSLENSRLAWSADGKLVGSAILYPVKILSNKKVLDLGIIGAVATAPDFRGKGISSQLIKDLEEIARRKDLDGLILWSDQLEFYGKLGFAPMGQQEIFSVKNIPAPTSLLLGSAVSNWDWAQIRIFYEMHPLRSSRSDAYWESIKKIQSCEKRQWVDQQGKVLAYLGFNRGRDMQNIIHEWGGDPQALRQLVYQVVQTNRELLWLTHPYLKDSVRGVLAPTALVQSSHLALMKSLKFPHVFDDIWFWGLDSL